MWPRTFLIGIIGALSQLHPAIAFNFTLFGFSFISDLTESSPPARTFYFGTVLETAKAFT
jgi:hypothetical protein